jgi:NAD(P)-dependent dehydrogenase (short-subunit alcohol dehydrogenase family)
MDRSEPQLAGKVIVVTGTSRGIGAGLAERLLAAGARVVGSSRSLPDPVPTDVGYFHVQGDVTNDLPGRLLSVALDRHGRVDALVNNAGIQLNADCWAQTDEELDEMLAVNLTAPFTLSQAFARHWSSRSVHGVILNICSIVSRVGWPDPGQSGYTTTKGGLLGLTRAMALELAEYNIRVVAIGPGAIKTGMAPEDTASYASRIPLGGVPGTPRDIGEAAVFLLSSAASYITGEILYVDGGYLIT